MIPTPNPVEPDDELAVSDDEAPPDTCTRGHRLWWFEDSFLAGVQWAICDAGKAGAYDHEWVWAWDPKLKILRTAIEFNPKILVRHLRRMAYMTTIFVDEREPRRR